MTDFLDLLEAYHHWCVKEDCSRLEACQAWLQTLTTVPSDEMGWHRLGTGALDWLVPFPPDWEPPWRMLSARQMSLTVEALEYLEAHRPGAIAAAIALPPPAAAPPSPISLPPSPIAIESPPTPIKSPPASEQVPSILSDVPVHWGLTDVINCVSREAQKREAIYPKLVSEGRLSPDRARQELGQMKAALQILLEMRDKGEDARQRALFE